MTDQSRPQRYGVKKENNDEGVIMIRIKKGIVVVMVYHSMRLYVLRCYNIHGYINNIYVYVYVMLYCAAILA